MNSGKQGGAEALGEGCDIVTGETCVPASLNTSLGEAAVAGGCAYLGLQVKAINCILPCLCPVLVGLIRSPHLGQTYNSDFLWGPWLSLFCTSG
jgi:hypothetical protein